jgi:ubiquitin carboxyl-terminal hydrolase 4/11
MKETNGVDNESSTQLNPRKRKFRSRRPKWIDPNQFLPAEFNGLFELSYFGGNKELVPSGWNMVDEDKKFPLLSTRAPILREAVEAVEVDDEQAHSFVSTSLQSDSESSEEDVEDIPQLAPTRMNEESSDDDDVGPNTRVCRLLLYFISSLILFCFALNSIIW